MKEFLGLCARLYIDDNGLSMSVGTVAAKVVSVARFRSKAGHGRFLGRQKGIPGLVPMYGQGMHPKGPERPHAALAVRTTKHEAALAAVRHMQEFGPPPAGRNGRYTAKQIAVTCSIVGEEVELLAEYADFRLNSLYDYAERRRLDDSHVDKVKALAPELVATMTPRDSITYYGDERSDVGISRLLGLQPRYAVPHLSSLDPFTVEYREAFTELHAMLAAGARLREQLEWVRQRQGRVLSRVDRRYLRRLDFVMRHYTNSLVSDVTATFRRRPGRWQARSENRPQVNRRRLVSNRDRQAYLSPVRPRRIVERKALPPLRPVYYLLLLDTAVEYSFPSALAA